MPDSALLSSKLGSAADPRILLARKRWTLSDIEDASDYPGAWGVILGDLFCQKRMFPFSEYEICEFARQANFYGLKVAYQAPMYLTSRNWSSVLTLIDKLLDQETLHIVMLHDFGLLSHMAHLHIHLIWDRFGYGRTHQPGSEALVKFLLGEGISGFEVVEPRLLTPLADLGAKPIYRAAEPTIATFGRKCYTESILQAVCNQIPLCQKKPVRLEAAHIEEAKEASISYKVDGYQVLEEGSASPMQSDLKDEEYMATWKIILNLDNISPELQRDNNANDTSAHKS